MRRSVLRSLSDGGGGDGVVRARRKEASRRSSRRTKSRQIYLSQGYTSWGRKKNRRGREEEASPVFFCASLPLQPFLLTTCLLLLYFFSFEHGEDSWIVFREEEEDL